eukprot:1157218-Pelagomonas_calceolata.AAC.18
MDIVLSSWAGAMDLFRVPHLAPDKPMHTQDHTMDAPTSLRAGTLDLFRVPHLAPDKPMHTQDHTMDAPTSLNAPASLHASAVHNRPR